jgi:hypothetical protein
VVSHCWAVDAAEVAMVHKKNDRVRVCYLARGPGPGRGLKKGVFLQIFTVVSMLIISCSYNLF